MAWPKGKPRKGHVPQGKTPVNANKAGSLLDAERAVDAAYNDYAARVLASGTAYQLEALAVFFDGFDKQAVEYVVSKLRGVGERTS